jgi:hypothetical protein
VGRAFRTGVDCNEQHCRVELHDFAIRGTPFERGTVDAKDDMHAYIENRFHIKNREMMITGSTRGSRALVISVESAQRDVVVERLFEQLSESAEGQFSKTRPGVLCVQFVDISNAQIEHIDSAEGPSTGLRQPSYIWRRTSDFLGSPRRDHVLSVSFRGNRGSIQGRASDEPTPTREEGYAFCVTNDHHPRANDRRYSIFAEGPDPHSRILLPPSVRSR